MLETEHVRLSGALCNLGKVHQKAATDSTGGTTLIPQKRV